MPVSDIWTKIGGSISDRFHIRSIPKTAIDTYTNRLLSPNTFNLCSYNLLVSCLFSFYVLMCFGCCLSKIFITFLYYLCNI